MAGKVYDGDIGTTFKVSTGIDLTSATAQVIEYKKPDGTYGTWTASIESPATAGVIYYKTIAVLTKGTWTIQAKVTFGTDVFYGESVTFTVYDIAVEA